MKNGETCSDHFKGLGEAFFEGVKGVYAQAYMDVVLAVLSAANKIVIPMCPHMISPPPAAAANYFLTEKDYQSAMEDPVAQPQDTDFRGYYKDG